MIVWAGLCVAALLGIERAAHFALLRGLRAERVPHQTSPANFRLAAQAVSVPTGSGKRLFGWYLPPTLPVPAPAVVLMHGWGANAAMMLPAALPIQAAGWGVLVLDARCHGRSDDERFTSMPRFAEDISSGLDWLRSHSDVDSQRLAVLGHSVGGAAALLCASRRPELRAVISLSAFAHPREVMLRMFNQRRLPYPLVGWYALHHVQRVIGHRFDEIAPLTTLPRVHCPVLIVHGTEDRTVSVDDARRLFAQRQHEQVQLLLVPGDHDLTGTLTTHGDALSAFLARAFAMR